MLVDISKITLKEVNGNKKLCPYLSNYPFKAQYLDMVISFKDQYGKGRVYSLNQFDERVYFESIKLFKSNHPSLWRLLIEVYEEAGMLHNLVKQAKYSKRKRHNRKFLA